MKKRTNLTLLFCLLFFNNSFAQVDGENNNFVLKSTSFGFDDFWKNGGGGIRGLVAGTDIDKDGLYEIITTDYDDGGKVHIFEITGDNQLQWIWSSPGFDSTAVTTCRFVGVSDLDGNGKQEILLSISESTNNPSSAAGIYVYEWTGQNNGFNSEPNAITRGKVAVSQFKCDSFFAKDIDNDGKEELVLAINGDGDQDYFVVLSVNGNFALNNVIWIKEAEYRRNVHFQGDAVNVLSSDLDGDGHWEILGQSAYNMMILPIEAVLPDQYAVGTSFIMNENFNDVNLINGVAIDIDGDGRDEVFYNGWKTGNLYLLSTDGDALSLDETDVTVLSHGGVGAPFASFGMAFGDQDHGFGTDGKDLYIGAGGSTSDLFNLEYVGGDVKNPNSYQWHINYYDPTDGNAIVTRVVAPSVDLDKDGNKELVLGYQSIPDNIDGQPVDKHWLRILEYDFPTSVNNNAWNVEVPAELFLVENYPNPFTEHTIFSVTLRIDGSLQGSIFNVLGQRVATIVERNWHQEGTYNWRWDGTDDSGNFLPSGIYYASFNLNGYKTLKRITLLR